MNAKQKKLFEDAIQYLRTIYEEKRPFDLDSWAAPTGHNAHKRNHECGTTACAMGWIALNPAFQTKGLFLAAANRPDTPIKSLVDLEKYFQNHDHPAVNINYKEKVGGTYHMYDGVNAACKFFGITFDEAVDLFMPENYRNYATARDVAKKMTNLLRKYESEGWVG